MIQELETGHWLLNRIHLEKHSELTDYAWSTLHDILYLVSSPPLAVYWDAIPSAMSNVYLFVGDSNAASQWVVKPICKWVLCL